MAVLIHTILVIFLWGCTFYILDYLFTKHEIYLKKCPENIYQVVLLQSTERNDEIVVNFTNVLSMVVPKWHFEKYYWLMHWNLTLWTPHLLGHHAPLEPLWWWHATIYKTHLLRNIILMASLRYHRSYLRKIAELTVILSCSMIGDWCIFNVFENLVQGSGFVK